MTTIEAFRRNEVAVRPAVEEVSAVSSKAPFSSAEIAAFRAEDRGAATAIVMIMMAIFLAAVAGYTFICFWVARG